MRQRAALAAIAAAVTVMTAAPGASAQIPFGANLNRPANANFDCTVLLLPDFLGRPTIAFPTNVTTCTWFTSGTATNQSEKMFVPTGVGTVVRVRIRVGPVTGPMQIVVLRGLRNPREVSFSVCCREVARTAVFTPAPQAVTTINTALPVKADAVPNPISDAVDFDILGLSVLAPGVPIPAHDTGNYNPLTAPISQAYYPHVSPGQERPEVTGQIGYQVLVNADWVPGVASAGNGQISLIQPVASVTRGNAIITIGCNQAQPCVGFLTLGPSALAGRARGPAGYGKRARFRIGPRKTARVRVPLTDASRRLLKRKRRARMWVNGKMGGRRALAVPVTVRR